MSRYLALLRGINVGGKNVIKMADLRECFEKAGFTDVLTYIQSGNVIFNSPREERKSLTARIEKMLNTAFDNRVSVVLRSKQQLQTSVASAPDAFGTLAKQFQYDIIFLKEPLTAKVALKEVETKSGVDVVVAGRGVLYFSRLISKASQSRLSRLVSKPVYQQMTIRNWNTTTKLLQLIQGTLC